MGCLCGSSPQTCKDLAKHLWWIQITKLLMGGLFSVSCYCIHRYLESIFLVTPLPPRHHPCIPQASFFFQLLPPHLPLMVPTTGISVLCRHVPSCSLGQRWKQEKDNGTRSTSTRVGERERVNSWQVWSCTCQLVPSPAAWRRPCRNSPSVGKLHLRLSFSQWAVCRVGGRAWCLSIFSTSIRTTIE